MFRASGDHLSAAPAERFDTVMAAMKAGDFATVIPYCAKNRQPSIEVLPADARLEEWKILFASREVSMGPDGEKAGEKVDIVLQFSTTRTIGTTVSTWQDDQDGNGWLCTSLGLGF